MQFRSVQALRGIAAMLVVIFHVSGSSFVTGAAGVDIFFIISGFIMGTVGVGDTPSRFLRKRLIRIVPLYWGVTLAMCVGALIGIFRNFDFDTASLVHSLLFLPYFDASGKIWPLVVVGWTLNYEMFFYVVFAIGLFLARPILVPVLVMCCLVVLGFAVKPEAAALQIWTSPLLIEFTAGLLLSQFTTLKGRIPGLIMIAASILLFVISAQWHLYEGALRAVAWGIPAFLAVAGFLAVERAGAWPTFWARPLEELGDISYSLYLLHGIVVAFGHRFLGNGIFGNVIIILASLAVAELSYRLFEKPVGKWLNAVTSGTTRKLTGAAQ